MARARGRMWRERAVWEKLLATGKTGAWEGPIRARLDAQIAAVAEASRA